MTRWIGIRGRTVLRTGAWSLLAKASAAAVYVLSIPLAYSALDPAQFGLWATLVSIVAFSTFMDFGIGNGCMNFIASAHAKGDSKLTASVFRQGLQVLTALAAVMFGIYFLAVLLMGPAWLASGALNATGGLIPSATLAVGAALFSAPLSLGLRARLATGRGDAAFRWQTTGHVGALVALVVASKYQPTLLSLTSAALLPPLLASAINVASVAFESEFRHPPAMDGPQRWQLRRSIIKEGGLFFTLQLAAALAFSADLLLISWIRGTVEAGHYAVVQRLFSIVPMGLALAWAPLWPIYRSALATGGHRWIARTLGASTLSAVIVAMLACPLLVAFHSQILDWFAPGHAGASWLLLWGFAVWTLLEAAGTAVATFLNSASILRFQVISAIMVALAAVGAKIWVLHSVSLDVMPWATSVVYCAFFVLPLAVFWKSIWHSTKSRVY